MEAISGEMAFFGICFLAIIKPDYDNYYTATIYICSKENISSLTLLNALEN